MTPRNTANSFGSDQARARVEEWAAAFPPLVDADIARVPEIDAAGLYAFSVMPRLTGKAGEIIQMVGPDEMLTSGSDADFDSLMARLGIGTRRGAVDVHTFAGLFLRLRLLRRGVVLDRPDGHVLLEPEQLPADKFSTPRADFDATGARYRFWMFDTDRLEPVFWDVRVGRDGATTFASQEDIQS